MWILPPAFPGTGRAAHSVRGAEPWWDVVRQDGEGCPEVPVPSQGSPSLRDMRDHRHPWHELGCLGRGCLGSCGQSHSPAFPSLIPASLLLSARIKHERAKGFPGLIAGGCMSCSLVEPPAPAQSHFCSRSLHRGLLPVSLALGWVGDALLVSGGILKAAQLPAGRRRCKSKARIREMGSPCAMGIVHHGDSGRPWHS